MRGFSGSWSTALAIGIVALMVLPAAAGFGAAPRAAGAPVVVSPAAAPRPLEPHPSGTVAHDLLVTTPALGEPVGTPVGFTASLAGVAGLSNAVNWTWGDGSVSTGATGQLTHSFTDPGLYEIEAQTTVGASTSHDNWQNLLALPVWATHTGDTTGTSPQLTGWVVRNGTSSAGATAVLPVGGSVTVSTQLTEPIPAPSVTGATGSFAVPGALSGDATFSGQLLDPLGVSTTTVTFSAGAPAGLYPLTFSFSATVHVDNTSYAVAGAFVFTVALGGGAGGGAVPYAQSADPTTLTAYWLAGPAVSTPDPAIDWESNGAQLFRNVYQTLIIPNGTATGADPSSFLPEMAACVPGSAQCTSLFGTSLVNGYNFTFVLSNTSQFYDPATGGYWPVYPTDVEFSIARSLAFVTGYCTTCVNGWMLAGALLPFGNGSWDAGLHAPFNNTPAAIAASMTINDSTDCPSGASSAPYDGCITFHAHGFGGTPAFFLQLLANPTGGTIEPCGWFSSSNQNAGLPDWTQGNVSGAGDGPCPAWSNPGAISPTAWDAYELDAVFSNEGLVYTSAAGSGPYYLSQWSNYTGYTLGTNPAYAANPNCVGASCEPAAGTYIPNVVVNYESATSTGLAALASGAADWAQAGAADTGTLASDAATGLAFPSVAPALEFYANGFDFQYNASLATNLSGLAATAPSEFLTDLNLRQFLIASFPTANVTSGVFNANGTAAAFSFGGGVIPLEDGGAAPSNISWPSGNPDTNPSHVGSAAWWWNQTTHDSQAGPNCTRLAPCKFVVGYLAPAPLVGAAEAQWAASVTSLSGGAIVPEVFASNITDYLNVLFTGPGGSPFAVTAEGWINDYPDATDPANALLGGSYGPGNGYAVLQALQTGSCSSSVAYWADLTTPIPSDCQGAAFDAAELELENIQAMPLGPTRNASFGVVDEIEQHLGLYGSVAQLNTLAGVAGWVDPASLAGNNPWLSTDGMDWYAVRERTGPSTPLSVRGPVASPPVIPSTGVLNLSAAAVGGAGGYTYAWSGLPGGCSAPASSTFSCHPNTAGMFTVTVTVRDGLAHTASASVTILITGLAIASFSATPATVPAGHTTTITTVLAVAATGVTYLYSGLPGGCASVNASSFACTPNASGVFHLGVTVTAPNGSRGAASTTLTVLAGPLAIPSFTATPATIDLASSTTFTVVIVNATDDLATVSFSGVPGCVGTAAAANITTVSTGTYFGVSRGCTPSATGGFTVVVNVTSGASYALAMTTLTVSTLPTVKLAAGPTAIDMGQPVTFTATTQNGSAPFAFSYTGLPSGCTSTDTPTLTCTPTAQGTSVVTVHLQDADAERASATATVTVSADLALVQFVAVPDTVPIGGSTNLSVRVNGGSAPLAYAYTGLPASCPSSNTGVLLCLPTTEGTYLVTVTVSDAAGRSITGTAELNVTSNVVSPPPPTFLGLPQTEGYGVLALLVILVLVAVVALAMRRPKAPPPEPAAPSEAAEPVETTDPPAEPDAGR